MIRFWLVLDGKYKNNSDIRESVPIMFPQLTELLAGRTLFPVLSIFLYIISLD